MKHGIRFWQKKLGRTPQHRHDLMRNLLTELIHHERITTTVAKAKFVKHEMERMINMAKRGSSVDWRWARNSLRSQELTVPKLMHSLADRYRDRQGGYLRIVRKGYNASGSDRAPKAIVELVNNPYDLVYGEAKLFGNRVLKQLRDVEGLKYKREAMKLQDPMTGKEVDVFKLTERVEMAGKERRKLTLREVGIHKRLIRMRQSLISYPMARKAEHRNSHLIPPSEFRERQLKLQREVREVRRYHRKPSPKFRETISQHGFMVNSRYKVVPMPGVVQPLALSPGSTSATLGYIRKAPRKKALASGTLTKATAPSDATLSNKAGTNVQHDKPAKPEEDQSFTQKMLSRMGFGRFYSGRSKK